jgi:hypothetical protein
MHTAFSAIIASNEEEDIYQLEVELTRKQQHAQVKEKKLDRYQVLSRFAVWLKRDLGKSDDRVRKMVTMAKLFLEHHDIEFGERIFRARVELPRSIQRL